MHAYNYMVAVFKEKPVGGIVSKIVNEVRAKIRATDMPKIRISANKKPAPTPLIIASYTIANYIIQCVRNSLAST